MHKQRLLGWCSGPCLYKWVEGTLLIKKATQSRTKQRKDYLQNKKYIKWARADISADLNAADPFKGQNGPYARAVLWNTFLCCFMHACCRCQGLQNPTVIFLINSWNIYFCSYRLRYTDFNITDWKVTFKTTLSLNSHIDRVLPCDGSMEAQWRCERQFYRGPTSIPLNPTTCSQISWVNVLPHTIFNFLSFLPHFNPKFNIYLKPYYKLSEPQRVLQDAAQLNK